MTTKELHNRAVDLTKLLLIIQTELAMRGELHQFTKEKNGFRIFTTLEKPNDFDSHFQKELELEKYKKIESVDDLPF